MDTIICCIRKGETDVTTTAFSSLMAGDTFFSNGKVYTVGTDAHYSGDASYDGYLLYDSNGYSWFPEELDDQPPKVLEGGTK